ncbi:kinase suppressor of Ras 1 isoform X4 [Xiphophorus couchianus]|uniref:kinase suppressor of Ras 1 isoform X4 n=1 Tax=Xiphophorus couchianus TaxID=32473 RepID=UPI001015FCB9|nr:kinase suppressor of Ras 1 isoform X4 [Xiphophorus couchianus]
MDSVSANGGKMVESDEQQPERHSGGGAAMAALHQCELIQNMIDISISSLQGLRTKCAASNDLTQQEIRTLEVKLMKYICKQLQCKRKVPDTERPEALDSYPRLRDWLRTVNLRPELIQAVETKLSLDTLLQMTGAQVRDAMRRLGSSSEECARLGAALSCLKSATESGGEMKEDSVSWLPEPTRRDSGSLLTADQLSFLGTPLRPHSPSPLARPSTIQSTPSTPSATFHHPRSGSVSAAPTPDGLGSYAHGDSPLTDLFPMPRPRTTRLHGHTSTPPVTPPSNRRQKLKPPCTPPPPSRKVLHLLPNITLTRSKSHESQLGNRIEDPPNNKCGKKSKLLLNMQVNGNGCEDSPSRYPVKPARTPGVTPAPNTAPYTLPGTPTLIEEHSIIKNNVALHRSSPKAVRRDIGLAVTHRFSTKSWLSQTCQVCQKNMMFGVKCKHCRLKCHNKCTKEAPSCRISFLPIAKIRRTESVPSDINNPVDRPQEAPQFGTLPKAITKKDHPPVMNQLDSSSNPSSTTSSTPSSPAPFQQSNPPSATPPPNPSPKGHRDNRFNFPDVCSPTNVYSDVLQDTVEVEQSADDTHNELVEDEDEEEGDENIEDEDPEAEEENEEDDRGDHGGEYEEDREEMMGNIGSDGECDELDDLPCSRGNQWKGPISRKPSQTSVYLQEWDIPFEQLDLGELIGKGRWGRVHKGRWHGEVAIRLLEIDGNNQDHLKLFKKEVMNYRQTRHENVVLFMGACMAPPHLAIITSFCKGRTLYSVVRDTKNNLDINKTRQIAQEIVKGMGYLHAKGIVHKDLKSKNVFHDTNKVVITDFGLFGISGVVQEGRRENKLRLPHGWICYLAPEIVRKMCPGNNEDRLPFSTAADVYAFGTIWYELQARDWPITNQPVEATIWQVGSGEGIKKVLGAISLGKEVTEILSACWAFDPRDRPTFTQLTDMLEKLPKLNRRLSHPGHFWKSAEL